MAILVVGSAIMLFPLVWQISSSLKTDVEIYQWPVRLIPDPPRWENYPDAVTLVPFGIYALNTTIITVVSVIGTLFSCSVVAYAFAMLRAPGKHILFAALLGTMMLPGQVTMIPIFIGFSKLEWIDTWYPLIVPTFFGNPFFVFLLRQFFLSLPPELADAAEIDGGNYLTIFLRIVLPLSKPALATVAIFSFIHHWNDFFGPLLYITSDSKRTLALGLMAMQANYFGGRQYLALVMAASVLMLVPILVIFFLAQRVFVSGVALTGITGR
ncbi:MAG: carbohydrate ABC transporter permease [Chloroflexi bacterium]|nr:carbohydrate ABC transporter permease [Chloroflexota bacterium]